jgi:hypothetical protein
VESIPQKAIAAAEKGATVFIVPIDHSTVSIMGRYEIKTVNLQSYLEEKGYYITVEEAENVKEIIAKFTSSKPADEWLAVTGAYNLLDHNHCVLLWFELCILLSSRSGLALSAFPAISPCALACP